MSVQRGEIYFVNLILKKIPRISQEDAAAIDRVVQEARVASIADKLSA